MNESETRAELIDPKLIENGWDSRGNQDVKVHREFHITLGKIKPLGGRQKPLIADYVLSYKGRKLAVVEAKSNDLPVGEGVAQAKDYATKLQLEDAYSTNGIDVYHIDMDSGDEGPRDSFHSPDELGTRTFLRKTIGKISLIPYPMRLREGRWVVGFIKI